MNKITINRKINIITEKLLTLKQFLEDYKKEEKHKKILYLASQKITEEIVESAIKINIIILKEHNIFSKSYKDSFLDLDKKVLKIENIEKLAETAKFRNQIAHEYDIITEEDFIKSANEIIKLYPKYLKNIKEYTHKNIN